MASSRELLEWSRVSLHYPAKSSASFLSAMADGPWRANFGELVRRVRSRNEARVIRGNVAIFEQTNNAGNEDDEQEEDAAEFATLLSQCTNIQRSHLEAIESSRCTMSELREISSSLFFNEFRNLTKQSLMAVVKENKGRRERKELDEFKILIEEQINNLKCTDDNGKGSVNTRSLMELLLSLESAHSGRDQGLKRDQVKVKFRQILGEMDSLQIGLALRKQKQLDVEKLEHSLVQIFRSDTVSIDARWEVINPDNVWSPEMWIEGFQRSQLELHEKTAELRSEIKALRYQINEALQKDNEVERGEAASSEKRGLEFDVKRAELFVDTVSLFLKQKEQDLSKTKHIIQQLQRECEQQGQKIALQRSKHSDDIDQLTNVNTVFNNHLLTDMVQGLKDKRKDILSQKLKGLASNLETMSESRDKQYSGSKIDLRSSDSKREKLCKILNLPNNSGPITIINEIQRLKRHRDILKDPEHQNQSSNDSIAEKTRVLDELKATIIHHNNHQVAEHVVKLRSELQKLSEAKNALLHVPEGMKIWQEEPAQKIVEGDSELKHNGKSFKEWKDKYAMALFQWKNHYQQPSK